MATTSTPLYVQAKELGETRALNNPNGLWTVYRSDNTKYHWLNVLRERNGNPRWREQIVKGKDASTRYYRCDTSYTMLPMLMHSKGTGSNPWETRASIYSGLMSDSPLRERWDNSLRDLALKRLKNKLRDLDGKYQAMVPLGELRELRTLVKGATGLTTQLVTALLRAKRTGGKSLWSFVQNAWLTWSFGIAPMMSDMRSLSEAVDGHMNGSDAWLGDLHRVSGKAKREWVTSLKTERDLTATNRLKIVGRAEHSLGYRFVVGHRFHDLRNSTEYNVLDRFGLTPPSLIPAIWELIAFSWLADYFGTIGDFLEDNFIAISGDSVYITENRMYRYRSILDYSPTWWPPYNGFYAQRRDGRAEWNYFEFERSPLTALPSRILRWKSLDEIGFNGWTKLMNLISLLKVR